MLSPYRVLDCTDERGHLAGLLLAQLGAEVILVEPPEGSAARRRSPRAAAGVDPERGLWHWAYNRGKRSVVLDLASPSGREGLLRLAAGADVLLWSGRPGELSVTYEELAAANPALVVAALTPWGLDGPKADWPDADLVLCASACHLSFTGNRDLAPLRWVSPQAYLHGAADLAVAALLALTERVRSGRGQLADVSAQVSNLQVSFCYSLNQAWSSPLMGRSGEGLNMGNYRLRWTYPAADGEVSITFAFGAAFAEFTGNLFRWIWEEGGCDEATRDKPWADLALLLFSGEEPASEVDRLADVVAAFTATRTKAELFAEAARRRVLLAPIATLHEVLANPHLAARRFWDHVPGPDGAGQHRMPGRFVVSSEAPLAELAAAPALGADTASVLAAPVRTPAGLARAAAPGRASAGAAARGPLAGLAVLDLSWSVAGPYVGRGLADFGADVVRVETRTRPDVSRTASPFHPRNEDHPLEGSGLYHNSNAGKLGVELDLGAPPAREVLWDLIRWADVILESFSAGAFERMGFSWERISELNPRAVLLSSCLPGQTGELHLPGYGNLSTALFGFTTVTRWPGRPAAGPFGAYTDIVSPRFGLAAVLAALDHRRRSGRGQHLDLSQAEASLHFLAPALLDAEVNDAPFEARGNHDPDHAPHGVYPCAGEDRWAAVVCTTDEQWRALAALLGREDLADLGLAERLARQNELDALVAAWTSARSAEAAQEILVGAGVAAHQVQNSPECLADPQLAHRGHYVTVEHPLLGPVVVEGPRVRLLGTPGATTAPGPTYGQHSDYVLRELLGYSDERIAELVVAGALG